MLWNTQNSKAELLQRMQCHDESNQSACFHVHLKYDSAYTLAHVYLCNTKYSVGEMTHFRHFIWGESKTTQGMMLSQNLTHKAEMKGGAQRAKCYNAFIDVICYKKYNYRTVYGVCVPPSYRDIASDTYVPYQRSWL